MNLNNSDVSLGHPLVPCLQLHGAGGGRGQVATEAGEGGAPRGLLGDPSSCDPHLPSMTRPTLWLAGRHTGAGGAAGKQTCKQTSGVVMQKGLGERSERA